MAELCPLFSGSTGNSYYIGSKSLVMVPMRQDLLSKQLF